MEILDKILETMYDKGTDNFTLITNLYIAEVTINNFGYVH